MTTINDHDHDHEQYEPWRTLGQIRDDLKQARAVLSKSNDPESAALTLGLISRALARIGDGSKEGGAE